MMMLHVQSRVCLSSAYFFACEVYFGDIVYHSYTGENMTRKSDDEGKGEEVTPMMMVVKMMVTMMTMMMPMMIMTMEMMTMTMHNLLGEIMPLLFELNCQLGAYNLNVFRTSFSRWSRCS